jgi:hypothetical protein
MQDLVQREMETTYGSGSVASVNLVYNTAKVEPLFNKYNNSKRQLDDTTDHYIGKMKRGKTVKRKQVMWCLQAQMPLMVVAVVVLGTNGSVELHCSLIASKALQRPIGTGW